MAEKPRTPAAKSKQPPPAAPPPVQQEPQSRFGLVFKILVVILSLCILTAIGFGAGVYFKLFDVEKITSDMNLSQYPVMERFLPKTNFEPVELEEDMAVPGSAAVPPVISNPAEQPAAPVPTPQMPNSNIITPEDLEKQAQLRQQEEAKRISKLARLYGGMKPDAAVTIMNELDDATVIAIFGKMEEDQVSKIMALFDSKRAARITEDMLRGQRQPPRL